MRTDTHATATQSLTHTGLPIGQWYVGTETASVAGNTAGRVYVCRSRHGFAKVVKLGNGHPVACEMLMSVLGWSRPDHFCPVNNPAAVEACYQSARARNAHYGANLNLARFLSHSSLTRHVAPHPMCLTGQHYAGDNRFWREHTGKVRGDSHTKAVYYRAACCRCGAMFDDVDHFELIGGRWHPSVNH